MSASCRSSPTLLKGAVPPQKKPYDVLYKVRTMQEIVDLQNQEIRKIQSLLEVTVSRRPLDVSPQLADVYQASTAGILLRHYNWNSERLQEQFWNDPSLAMSSAGLSPPSSPNIRPQPLPLGSPRRPPRSLRPIISPVKRTKSYNSTSASTSSTSFECPVCCCDFSAADVPSQTLALGCGHRFCRDCWSSYLDHKIQDEGESGRIQCMGSKCNRAVKGETIDELMPALTSKK